MSWLQITVPARDDQSELIEHRMEAAGALAVTMADAGDEPQLEPAPGATPLWRQVEVTGLFRDDAEGRRQIQDLSRALRELTDCPPRVKALADQAWERVWLDDFRPTRFGQRLWVCPQGQRPPIADTVVVDLDPGLAFGTGHHPTTALCLTWLDGQDLSGRTLIDYGCGSGILAIAAVRLGAARAIAVDHDPQAREATARNAAANGVAARIEVCPPERLAPVPADVLIANILAGPLVALAPILTGHLPPTAALALSGILREQVAEVAAAYTHAFELAPARYQEEWALLSGRRRGPE